MLLVAVFLVNLPFVHQTLSDRDLARSGTDVQATVLEARKVGGGYLVAYRLPRTVDPRQARYSARVDLPTFEHARESRALRVTVVPGTPANNRPEGEVTGHLFGVVALLGDLALLLFGLFAYRRWRLRSAHLVIRADGDDVTLGSASGQVTVVGPDGWAQGVSPGQRIRGSLHLVTDEEVVPGPEVGGLEQVHGSSYVVRGRVVDARAGQVVLELADRSRLRVQTGPLRIRADIRDPTEIRGTLCFTPAGLG